MTAALLLATAVALAPTSGALRNTAATLDSGEVVLRIPTAPSAVGLTSKTEVWVVPVDLLIGGPRLGVEQQLCNTEAFSLSVAPSIGQKLSMGRTSFKVNGVASYKWGPNRVNAVVAPELRLLRTLTLGEALSDELRFDRLHVSTRLAWDHDWKSGTTRLQTSVMVYDETEWATFATVGGQYIHRFGVAHLAGGVSLLVGQPTEHVFLGNYEHTLVSLYPTLDMWFQF